MNCIKKQHPAFVINAGCRFACFKSTNSHHLIVYYEVQGMPPPILCCELLFHIFLYSHDVFFFLG